MKHKTKGEAVFILNTFVLNCFTLLADMCGYYFGEKATTNKLKHFLVARIQVQNEVWTDMTDSWPTLETDGLRIASYSHARCSMTS